MRKHSDAIKKIRQTIKTLVGEKASLRKEILVLKYDQQGKRRPETGAERHSLKVHYDWRVRPKARAALLAYGLLRGIPYKKMEPKCDSNELYYVISATLIALHEAIGDNADLKLEWTPDRVKKIILDGMDPFAASEAA